ncbi:hypothetical protein AB5N19_01788 [Seiridium cardinale]
MASFLVFFLLALLPSIVSSQITTLQEILTTVQTVTEVKTITLTSPSEPSVLPVTLPTTYITDFATEVIASTLAVTISTRTVIVPSSTETVQYTCHRGPTGSISCGYMPVSQTIDPDCTSSTSTHTVTSTVTYTDTYCPFGPVSTLDTPSSTSTSSCDISEDFSCLLPYLTYSATNTSSSHRVTSTGLPVETTGSSSPACEGTSSSSSTSLVKSTFSDSPYGKSSSSRPSLTTIPHITVSSSGGYYPAPTSSSSPVTAGTVVVKPWLGTKVLYGGLAFISMVMVCFA